MSSCNIRKVVKTGDLLVWNKSYSGTKFWLNLVRFSTMSEFGHVSVAIRNTDGSLWHIEAVQPVIRKVPVPDDAQFYILPVSRVISKNLNLSFFDDKIGKRYSMMDALRSYFGYVTEDDDSWQCAELSKEFYEESGLTLPMRSVTPSRLVRSLMDNYHLSLYRSSAIS